MGAVVRFSIGAERLSELILIFFGLFFVIPRLKASTLNDTMTIPSGEGDGTVNSPLVTQGTSQFPTYGPAVVVEVEFLPLELCLPW